ncbi:MAG: site-specific DNA-methyltransferase [Synechococcus sp. SB0678_bin_12]|nr:site-specific DNA-methyltransferase [Synechococcus sp. SB0678_bin_12]
MHPATPISFEGDMARALPDEKYAQTVARWNLDGCSLEGGLCRKPLSPPLPLQINRIHSGDALQLVPDIPDGSVDLIVCDGPYGTQSHAWDQIPNIQEFNLRLIRMFSAKLKEGGALYLFGKPDCLDFIDYRPYLTLRSRIVWFQPSRLSQGRINYTNNYDIVCYFIKGRRPRAFNLDDIRVPQLVELEHRRRCEKVPSVSNGKFSKTKFNQKGKNPGNVWGEIKQLTCKSHELIKRMTLNTIQKPEKLIERLVKASSLPNDLVLDPFCGTGTCPVVCKRLGRNFIAIESDHDLITAANARIERTISHVRTPGKIDFSPTEKPADPCNPSPQLTFAG